MPSTRPARSTVRAWSSGSGSVSTATPTKMRQRDLAAGAEDRRGTRANQGHHSLTPRPPGTDTRSAPNPDAAPALEGLREVLRGSTATPRRARAAPWLRPG